MEIIFKLNCEPLRQPIKREPLIKITIKFMLMNCDNFQYESIKIPESKLSSESFRKFIMYSYLCYKYGPKTKGGIEGYDHIKDVNLYFKNITNEDNDTDDEYDEYDDKINNENNENNEIMIYFPSLPDYYINDGIKYHFHKIYFKYYD